MRLLTWRRQFPFAAALAVGFFQTAFAQNYPVRPVRLVVPFSPGGAADVPGRILTQKLSEALGQQVVVDNRPGAGSTIGAEQVAKAPPDGYTLLTISNTHFVSAALYKKLAYDSLHDFAPVTQVTSAPNIIVVHPSLPARTVKELVALAKARPGKIDYASSGNGRTAASHWRPVLQDGRHRDDAHPVSRQRTGHRRPAQRPGDGRFSWNRGHATADQGRKAEGACRDKR